VKHFEGLHSILAASCNFTLAAEKLVKHCKSAAYQLYNYFEALLWRCTALLISYGCYPQLKGFDVMHVEVEHDYFLLFGRTSNTDQAN